MPVSGSGSTSWVNRASPAELVRCPVECTGHRAGPLRPASPPSAPPSEPRSRTPATGTSRNTPEPCASRWPRSASQTNPHTEPSTSTQNPSTTAAPEDLYVQSSRSLSVMTQSKAPTT